jgi:hypothetical protein
MIKILVNLAKNFRAILTSQFNFYSLFSLHHFPFPNEKTYATQPGNAIQFRKRVKTFTATSKTSPKQ